MANVTAASRQDLHALVTRLRRNFPFYDTLLGQSAYEPGVLESLPLVTEATLSEHYYTREFPQLPEPQCYWTSGTSSGVRKRILWSQADHARYVAQRRTIFARLLPPGCRTACADLGTGHAAASALEVFESLGLEASTIDFAQPVERHVAHLNRCQPDLLFTMPMILDHLLAQPELRARPRTVVVVGDVVTPAWKRQAAERLGLQPRDLIDLYGSIEVGSMAHECTRCNRYHCEPHILAEALPPSRVFPGASDAVGGELIVLTSLARDYFPAVRCVLNDLVVDLRHSRCGGADVTTFERIIGRLGSELKHGEKLSLYDIASAVHGVLPAAAFDVRKTRDRLVIRICHPAFGPVAADAIRARLYEAAPAVKQMVASGLVAEIELRAAPREQLASGAKLSFRQSAD